MALPKEHMDTSEAYWNLPEGQRAELTDGRLYERAPPNYIHQKLVSQLTRIIGNYIAEKGEGCEVIPAPFAVNLHADEKTWVEPDISVIFDSSKLSERGCEGPPDWIVVQIFDSLEIRFSDLLK